MPQRCSKGTWTIPVADPRYANVLLRENGAYADYAVMVVHAAKLLRYMENDKEFSIPHARHWDPAERQEKIDFIVNIGAEEDPAFIPYVNIHKPGEISNCLDSNLPVVSFINGRHRTRVLEYLGANRIPVQVSPQSEALLREFCA